MVALTAELGPAERYRRWLAVRRGTARVVVGTRSAMFAPVDRPGLLAVWDDGDDLHAEPRAPYPHVRDVLLLRAHAVGAALLVGGFARTAEAQVLVGSGWAQEVVADRATLRTAAPRVTALNETGNQLARDPDQGVARLPAVAFEAARAALAAGRPVLVQVPRAGYLPWLACAHCRETARCRHCAGPLALPGGGSAGGSRVGRRVDRWRGCRSAAGAGGPSRRSAARRARRVGCGPGSSAPGAPRRSWAAPFPGRRCAPRGAVPRSSTACPPGPTWWSPPPAPNRPRRGVTGRRCCSTGGRCCRARTCGWRRRRCGAGWRRRRWWCRPRDGGRLGRVVVAADAALPPVQALVRWDPAWHAAAELAARTEVGFPPAVRMASVEGTAPAVAEVVDALLGSDAAAGLGPPGVEVLGPVELDPEPGADPAAAPRERALVRVPREQGRSLAAALAAVAAQRSARKAPDPVRVRLDPPEVG